MFSIFKGIDMSSYHKLKFLIPISLQLDVGRPLIFQVNSFSLKYKGLHRQVAKIVGLEYLNLRQKLNSFECELHEYPEYSVSISSNAVF